MDTVCKPQQIKVTEDITFALIYAISEAVCKERVACETLDFLHEETKWESGGGIKGGGGCR